MADTLEKLRPDRDLQCYFFIPSAVAALSGASENAFTLSGSFRQQFDWAVVEWNRDNTFEHPAFRYLPDGDLSGLTLSYQETRTNCVPMDSDINPTVAWPSLRIWADAGSGEQIYFVPLLKYASAVAGIYQSATVELTLQGTVTAGDYVGFSFLDEHYTYQYFGGDALEVAIQQLAAAVKAFSPTMDAAQINGTTIQLHFKKTGLNGNRIGVYTYVSGGGTEQWDAPVKQFSDGTSPTTWQVTIPFGGLDELPLVAAKNIRKMRWTYAADIQNGAYQRSEFQVTITNWTVTGVGREYSVAGPGSRRIEDDDPVVQYTGNWTLWQDNFSGGSIHYVTGGPASLSCKYYSPQMHSLYLGVLRTNSSGTVQVSVDGGAPTPLSVSVNDDNVLARLPLGEFGPGDHTVSVTNGGAYFYFDFLEIAIPRTELPVFDTEPKFTLATDWDTYQSLSIAPERTAWMINSLGFKGRVNHYVGALWFYELVPQGQQYASATVTFTGSVDTTHATTSLVIGEVGGGPSTQTTITHLNLIGDTPETLATAFALLINGGYTAIRAEATGNQLTIFARAIGKAGEQVSLVASTTGPLLTVTTSGSALSGGSDGNSSANGTNWFTDLSAIPRINRAARDWHSSYFQALKGYGIDVTASFSMELGNGDPSVAAGIAQRHSTGEPVVLNTPSLQTNFSPASMAFWQQVYADMAAIQNGAGVVPYLQFGEVQWWYFPYNIVGQDPLGMPFYDAYTTSAFQAKYGYPLPVIATNGVDPSTVADAAAFLPGLIGAFTQAVMSYVLASYPNCRFEVLYPTDVNDTPLNQVINYPTAIWTPQNLTCLKTESFSYTFERNLDMAARTIATGVALGFLPSQRSHLVGLEMASTAWLKEARLAEANAMDSVVLFALDQFCLIGYSIPLGHGMRRSSQFGQ